MKNNRPVIFCLLLSLLGYLIVGYGIQRENFLLLASTYALVFGAYVFLVRKSEEVNGKLLFTGAIVFRLSFLFSLPVLSDDYYRFLFDGSMTVLWHNPYTALPSTFIRHSNEVNDFFETLYSGMNSPDYYTVYPPLLQFLFAGAAFIFPHNITGQTFLLHAVCITADIGSIFLLKRLLNQFQFSPQKLWWYALNPLVIIELSGNLHFEAVMIFFLLLAVYLLAVEKNFLSAAMYGLAVSAKLIPLLFLPFLIKRFRWQSVFYFAVVALTCLVMFLPFIDNELVNNLASSLDLYFQKFEFNASIFYLVRWMGFEMRGYDVIHQVTPVLSILTFLLVMVMMLREKQPSTQNLFAMMQWALTIYLLLSTTVHPWYIVPLVMMSVFTEKKFPIVWSLMVILSYATYQTKPYAENLGLTAIEYLIVGATLIYEWRIDTGKTSIVGSLTL